jgi:hypothetical protein
MRENLLPALIGIVLRALYTGFLALKIGALPLILIVGAVLAMTFVDFVRTIRH